MPKSSSLIYYTLYLAIGILYPAYCSLTAVETPDRQDDRTWLVYWTVFAAFTVLEFFTDFLLFWFPLYPIAKLGFLLWCSLPIKPNGSILIYKFALKPFIGMYGGHINSLIVYVAGLVHQVIKLIPFP